MHRGLLPPGTAVELSLVIFVDVDDLLVTLGRATAMIEQGLENRRGGRTCWGLKICMLGH